MDLQSYMNIENLSELASSLDIAVPRLRGYSLMKDELKIDGEYFSEMLSDMLDQEYESIIHRICCGVFLFNAALDKKCDKFFPRNKDREYHRIPDWRKIHGKFRKKVKTVGHNTKHRLMKYANEYNEFCGGNYLRVHARIGGPNWTSWDGAKITEHPLYVGRLDDLFDNTYCDIFFRIPNDGVQNG